MILTVQDTNNNTDQINGSLIAAADWLVTINSGEFTAQQQAEFQQWLQRKENAQAYEALKKTWNKFDLDQPKAAQKTINFALANKPSVGKSIANNFTSKTRLYSIAALAGLSLVLASQSTSGRFVTADYYTLTERTQRFTLSDNSKIQLLPRSAVNIHYSQHQRHIELIKGQVFIEVAKDADRPLIITSQHGSAQALGTAFSVAVHEDDTSVQVTESHVNVCAKLVRSSCKTLSAGQQTTLTSKQVQAVTKTSDNFKIDWQQQTLTVDNQALSDVLNMLQQHYPGYLKYDDQAVKNLTISGVFSLQNTQDSLNLIAKVLPVKVRQYAGVVLILSKE